MRLPTGAVASLLVSLALLPIRVFSQQLTAGSAQSASLIQEMVDAVSRDSIIAHISTLQGFGTRYEYTSQRDSAGTYLLRTFARSGISSESDWYVFGTRFIVDLEMVTADSIWAVGDNSMIVASTDGGDSWAQQTSPLSAYYYGVDFASRFDGWAVGASGVIIHTTNAGVNWVQQTSPVSSTLYDVGFADAALGIAVGAGGIVLRTTNGGGGWSQVTSGTNASFRRAKVLSATQMWAVGDGGAVIHSTDGGASWAPQTSGVLTRFYEVEFITPLTGWIVGTGPTLCKTTNGGTSWGRITLPAGSTSSWGGIAFLDSLEGYAATLSGVIYRSTDGGLNWSFSTSQLNLGWGPTISAIRATAGGKILYCGSRGTLTASTDHGATWRNLTPFLPPTFLHQSRNIIATIPGRTTPERECIIVAHYDSYSNGIPDTAPGANDNATGTSAVMEAVRICSRYAFNSTVKFLAVSAEEMGMFGSTDYVIRARNQGTQIVAAINGDMIGYPLAGDTARLAIGSYLTRNWLIDSALTYNTRYGIGLTLVPIIDSTGASDYGPFALAGYDALDIAEGTAPEIWGGADPYYHTTGDLLSHLNPGMVRRGAQLMLAAVAEVAGPVEKIVSGPDGATIPEGFALEQNYPNPFNPSTTIRYGLPERSDVTLVVFNTLGQQVATLVQGEQEAGYHEVRFNAKGLSSGVYFYRLTAGEFARTRALLLVR